MIRWLTAIGVLCLISGCIAPHQHKVEPTTGPARVQALIAGLGWRVLEVPAGAWQLVAAGPAVPRFLDQLVVYIEGDGRAWVTPSRASDDPTPTDPIALRLAMAHPSGEAVWIARPCQYQGAGSAACGSEWWTRARFAPEVIAAMDTALDVMKARHGAKRLVLVGYSGGGAVAALLAAHRKDVERLVTVAGNLDHRAWTHHHAISPLVASLDARDVMPDLRDLQQVHIAGSRDRVMPVAIVQNFAERMGPKARFVVIDADHHCCWVDAWPRLWPQVDPTAMGKP